MWYSCYSSTPPPPPPFATMLDILFDVAHKNTSHRGAENKAQHHRFGMDKCGGREPTAIRACAVIGRTAAIIHLLFALTATCLFLFC